MITNIETELHSSLFEYVNHCEEELLLGQPAEFHYPKALVGKKTTDSIWGEKVNEIKALNKLLLSGLRNKANIYAIFTKDRGSNSWDAKYVGESKSVDMRTRMTAHLIKKHNMTGSKLAEVRASISKGKLISIRFIYLPEEALRTFIEEKIISNNKNSLEWNKNS